VVDNNIIDAVVAVSMAFMAVSLMLLVASLMNVLQKGMDTLGSVQRLCNTLDQEVGPTAVQLREVMNGVNQLRGATTQRISAVSHKVEDVAGSLTTAVDQAQKQTSVMSTGLLAGIQAYLRGKSGDESSNEKRLTMDKGEQHE
jgi:uncharacterized protein YoxC